jgi:hypothetical protein
MSERQLVDIEIAARLRDAATQGGNRSACEIEWLSPAAERAGLCNRIHTCDIEAVGGSVHAAARRDRALPILSAVLAVLARRAQSERRFPMSGRDDFRSG